MAAVEMIGAPRALEFAATRIMSPSFQYEK
jgi:hypothetical protein